VLEREVVLTFVCGGFKRVVQWLVMSGKWGPNDTSVMTCERFISKGNVGLDVGEEGRTNGYGRHVHSSHNHGRG